MLDSPATVLITGGTSGIGRELARQLHASGHEVVVIGRSEKRIASLRQEMPAIAVYRYDLGDSEAARQCWSETSARHPNITVLINNAAAQHTYRFTDHDFDYRKIAHEVGVNLIAPFCLSGFAVNMFLADNRRAGIVNLSSGLAFFPKTSATVYCATKAAIHSFSQGLRYQLEGTRISVAEVILPLVDTPMTAGRGTGKISAGEAARQIIAGISKGTQEIYVGKARWLPLLMRLAPSAAKRVLRRN